MATCGYGASPWHTTDTPGCPRCWKAAALAAVLVLCAVALATDAGRPLVRLDSAASPHAMGHPPTRTARPSFRPPLAFPQPASEHPMALAAEPPRHHPAPAPASSATAPLTVAALATSAASAALAALTFCTAAVCRLRPAKPALTAAAVGQRATDAAMHATYQRLADHLVARLRAQADGQWWVAIAGGPGSGKSTLAAAVVRRVNEQAGAEVAVVLPMDGFHYSRRQLKAIADMNAAKGRGPTFDELIARRGAPWTFGAPALCTALAEARQLREASLPAYSREKSDPVPHGVELRKDHRIVLVEGNYVLMYDDPLWAPLQPLFDERWFLRVPKIDEQRRRLVDRHMETWTAEKDRLFGPGRVGAAIKVDTSDLLNMEVIEASAKHADRIIDSLT
eukprot:EG_transcript_10492